MTPVKLRQLYSVQAVLLDQVYKRQADDES